MSDKPELILSSLGSGSNGNAFLLEHGESRILVDAGVPIRTLLKCLALRGVAPQDIDAILLSHEHTDHMKALTGIHRRASVPVLATRGTLAGIDPASASRAEEIAAMTPFTIDGVEVTPIPVSHDAREPVGFFVQTETASVAIMTDLGEVSDINAEYASRADHLVIESNYDEDMLRTGRYPVYLKRRIRSNDGHLSNDHCAEFLVDVITERTASIWLSHLSENNNRPEIALKATSARLQQRGHLRNVRALPRYDGSIVTWRSTEVSEVVHQSSLPF